jgi:hypothetical protein
MLSFAGLGAGSYDDDTLRIFAKIAPRLVLMSTVRDRVDKSIDICIVSEQMDEGSAGIFGDMIKQDYPNGMKGYPVSISYTDYSRIQSCQDAHLLFLFDTSPELFDRSIDFARMHHLLTAVYDEKLLAKGADISLHLGRKVLPFLNLQNIRDKDITMDNPLIRISKIYEGGAK